MKWSLLKLSLTCKVSDTLFFPSHWEKSIKYFRHKREITFLIIRTNLDLVSEYQQHQDAPLEEEVEDGYDDAYDENIES